MERVPVNQKKLLRRSVGLLSVLACGVGSLGHQAQAAKGGQQRTGKSLDSKGRWDKSGSSTCIRLSTFEPWGSSSHAAIPSTDIGPS
jgi:hypothetical protein